MVMHVLQNCAWAQGALLLCPDHEAHKRDRNEVVGARARPRKANPNQRLFKLSTAGTRSVGSSFLHIALVIELKNDNWRTHTQ